ncbi:MAG: hypothetical protein JXX28_19070 [Deltaproteobacteria bacterium]|nr:hypothetical protein [Deltaproteobacteria bacterium]
MIIALLTQAALALSFPETQLEEVLGWTDDGAVVLKVRRFSTVAPAGQDFEDVAEMSERFAVVVRGDAEEHRWRLSGEYPDFQKVHPAPEAEAWKKWSAGHPLHAPATAPSGLQLRVNPTGPKGTWSLSPEGDGVQLTHEQIGEDIPIAHIGLSNDGDGFWELWTTPFPFSAWSMSATATARPSFSHDGRRVAVLFQTDGAVTMRGAIHGNLDVMLFDAAPLTSILAPQSLPASATQAAKAALAGMGALQTGPAKAARERSVVYYAEGFKPQAEAMAAKVPGGATVEAISWEAPQHVVVALGTSSAQ